MKLPQLDAHGMTDATCYVPPDLRQLWTSAVGAILMAIMEGGHL